jgi:hypothetical protein
VEQHQHAVGRPPQVDLEYLDTGSAGAADRCDAVVDIVRAGNRAMRGDQRIGGGG